MTHISDDDPIPETLSGILAEIADLTAEMSVIDQQFSANRAGMLRQDDKTWHPRALAKKNHILRRVKALKLAKLDLHEKEAARRAEAKDWKRRYHALRQLVWANCPELRGQINALEKEPQP